MDHGEVVDDLIDILVLVGRLEQRRSDAIDLVKVDIRQASVEGSAGNSAQAKGGGQARVVIALLEPAKMTPVVGKAELVDQPGRKQVVFADETLLCVVEKCTVILLLAEIVSGCERRRRKI